MTSDDTQPIEGHGPDDPLARPFEPAAPEPGPFEVPPQPVSPTAPPTKRRGTVSWINVALGLALVVAVGGVAFAAGRMTAPASAAGANGRVGQDGRIFSGGYFPGGPGGNGGQGQGPRVFGDGGAAVQGTVTAVTADSITIRTASGQEITIALDSSTTYHQQSNASASDVTTGGTVIVRLGFNRTGAGGPAASGAPTGPTATDVTVVPQAQ
jgi:hypothetical protein